MGKKSTTETVYGGGRPEILMGKIPQQVREQAVALGLQEAECLFSARSDMHLTGEAHEVWLVVTKTAAATLASGIGPAVPALTGPFKLSDIKKVRSFQTVGSAFLQFMIDGLYVSVVRYSNGYRESFSRVATQLERLVDGAALQTEALTRPSETVCQACGLPLPGPRAECPRCAGSRGIFARTLLLMKPYSMSIFLLLLMMICGVSLDLIPPMLTRTLVDRVLSPVQKENMHLLPVILLGLVAASAGRCVISVFIGRTSSVIGTRITKDLRQRLQAKLLSLSVEYYNRHSAGSLMSRVLYDVDYFQSFVGQVAQGFLLNLMLVLGIGTMLFFMNWRLAWLVLLPMPFVVLGTTFFWKYIYPRYYRLWDSQSKMSQLLTGLLQGIRLVKSFGQEDRELKRFGDAAGYMQQSRRSLEMSAATFNPIMGFVFGLGGLIIWYAGGHLVLGEMKLLGKPITLGTLMAFLGYLGMFYGPVQALSTFSSTWVTGFLSAGQRVFEVLDSSSVLPESPKPVRLPQMKGAIELRNVTFGYDPYTPVLKGVSLTIEPGKFVGVVGKSGSGKTTIVNLVCRFYDVQEGQVLIDGVDVRTLAQEDLHRRIGLVLQEPFLFRASIAENIAYGRPDASPMAIMDAARAANAHNFIARRPSAYDMKLGEHGAGLSGGERQRISIARALLCDPRILILDEATSSVDTESEQEIQKALSVVCKGRTTIAIAHRLSTLKNADDIYVLDDGRVAESGSHEQLLDRKGIYYKLVKIQTELTRLEVT